MGSLSLVCPMCCGETFDDSQSLKYHLLSMTDNLYCPNCAERSDSVAALIQHLDDCGRDCENNDEIRQSVDNGNGNVVSLNRTEDSDCGFLATVDDDGNVVLADSSSVQNEEHGFGLEEESDKRHGSSASAETAAEIKAFEYRGEEKNEVYVGDKFVETENEGCEKTEVEDERKEQSEKAADDEGVEAATLGTERSEEASGQVEDEGLLRVKQEICEEESEALYSCSSCGMSFNSVLEHIKDYHDGQEVVLEMAEQQIEELPNDVESSSSSSSCVPRITSESSTNRENDRFPSIDANSTIAPSRNRQTMNTLRTEECVDSEGRLYTRKVVQIERFWDRSSVAVSQFQLQQHQHPIKSGPMIEKFFSNAEGVRVAAKTALNPEIPISARRTYRCDKCFEEFGKLVELRIHVCPDGNEHCEICDQTFSSVKALQVHLRSHENDGGFGGICKLFVCPICATEFTSHKSLRLHSRMHAPVRSRRVDAPVGTPHGEFTCHECGKTLSESYRKAHTALHKGDSATCTVCNRKFDSPDSLAMHAAVHIDHVDHSHQQNQNNEQLPNNQNFQNNQQSSTFGERTPSKSQRGSTKSEESFRDERTNKPSDETSDNIVENEKIKDSQKPYQCQHCGRRFTRPHEKVKHERIHTGEKPHACEVCGKTFRVSYCLTLHMRTHTGVRPYACQHCGKRFKASSVYNHHLLTHGEKRAYTCPYCPKTFKTRVQLAGHKNSHTKPFRCTECSRPFASLYAARAHIQTHKKDNNFKFSCYVCGASYGRAFALKDHLKVHAVDGSPVAPEPAREEEVAEDEDFIAGTVIDDFEDMDVAEDEDKKLVDAAADATLPTA